MSTAFRISPVRGEDVQHNYPITGTPYRFVVATPDAEPELWEEFLAGAATAYSRFGIETALDPALNARNTSLFFAAIDAAGAVVGGVRTQGPYVSVDQVHAVAEWGGHPGEDTLRKMIADRLSFGIVEAKTAWVGEHTLGSREVTNAIARTALPMMTMLDAQFVLATASDYVLRKWASSGGRVAESIPPAPYPNPDSDAKVMWWDRKTFLGLADPGLVPTMLRETAALTDSIERRDRGRRLVAAG